MDIEKKTRDNIIKKIAKFFSKKISKNIELSIYKFSSEYAIDNETPFLLEQIYNTKMEELINQFKESKMLVKKINEGDFNAKDIAFLKVDQLHPEKYKKIIKKRDLEKQKKENKTTTSAFKCSKCGERKTTIEQKQTRSGDEPATIFITCTVCGNKWTQN